jgi:hypothetical protein
MAKMRLLDQPHGTWVSLETLKIASRYLDHIWNTWVSLKVLDQLWNTWVSLNVFKSAMEHMGQPQGTWISYGTLGSVFKIS